MTDGSGVPDFAVNISNLEADAFTLAALLAKDCDSPEKVSAHLEQIALANLGNSVYLSALSLRALRFLTEDIFAPILDVTEQAMPDHDFRGRLAQLAGDQNS